MPSGGCHPPTHDHPSVRPYVAYAHTHIRTSRFSFHTSVFCYHALLSRRNPRKQLTFKVAGRRDRRVNDGAPPRGQANVAIVCLRPPVVSRDFRIANNAIERRNKKKKKKAFRKISERERFTPVWPHARRRGKTGFRLLLRQHLRYNIA